MNRSNLAKLFGTLGVLALIIAVNTMIAGQGGEAILSIPLVSKERPAGALYGLILVGGLTVLTATLGLLHAVRTRGSWHQRIPAVWLTDLDTADWAAKVYQVVVVVLLVLVPAFSLLKFGDTVMSSKLCVQDGHEAHLVRDAWWNGFAGAEGQIRLVTDLVATPPSGAKCAGGVQVFPATEFIAIIILALLAAISALVFCAAVIWPSRRTMQAEAPLR